MLGLFLLFESWNRICLFSFRISKIGRMNRLCFKGKVALVTGSSRGIGRAVAAKLASLGADLVVTSRKAAGSSLVQAEELVSYVHGLGGRAILVQADISSKASVRLMMEAAETEFGRLDFLILNAARAPFKPIEKLFERDLRQLVDTNFLGNIFCIQLGVPLLERTQGKIVFISSLGSRFYNPQYPLGSMKAAMEAVVRDCAESLRHRNISVNAVCGGLVRTDSLRVLRYYLKDMTRIPEELFMDPEELADVVAFLCDHTSRGISGQTIVADRGLGNTLYRPLA